MRVFFLLNLWKLITLAKKKYIKKCPASLLFGRNPDEKHKFFFTWPYYWVWTFVYKRSSNIAIHLRTLLRSSHPISELGNVIGKFATNWKWLEIDNKAWKNIVDLSRISLPEVEFYLCNLYTSFPLQNSWALAKMIRHRSWKQNG